MNQESTIAPSILAANFSRLSQQINEIQSPSLEILHWDVMDNHFVPNLTFGPKLIADHRALFSDKIFDVHLMIEHPEKSIEDYAKAGADWITFHQEAPIQTSIRDVIEQIKSLGCKAGISVKPKTPIELIFPMLDYLDLVLIMSVEPGFGGQQLIPETLDKITVLREELLRTDADTLISIDGGIKSDHLKEMKQRGVHIIVMGTGFFKHSNPQELFDILR
jgi:ribulose-phosphate 3-epimerase